MVDFVRFLSVSERSLALVFFSSTSAADREYPQVGEIPHVRKTIPYLSMRASVLRP